jgi:hypothetical protein
MGLIKCIHCKKNVFINTNNYLKHLKKVHKIIIKDTSINKYLESQNIEISNHRLHLEQMNKSKEESKSRKIISLKSKLENEKEKKKKIELFNKLKFEVENNTTYYRLIWDDFIFKKDKIEIKTERIKTILLPIEWKGSFESLNLIKNEYFNKIHRGLFKLGFYNGELQKDLSPGWAKINNSIEKATEYYDYRYNFKRITLEHNIFEELTNIQIVEFFEKSFNKSHYLKYLAASQNSEYKIIPIWESINSTKEETFIFRLKTNKNKILVIWENANDSRASHLFIISQMQEKNQLKLIQDFITRNDITTKRSLLHNSSSIFSKGIKSELNYINHINHLNLNDYKNKIKHIINNY